jgi:hypothetical protein
MCYQVLWNCKSSAGDGRQSNLPTAAELCNRRDLSWLDEGVDSLVSMFPRSGHSILKVQPGPERMIALYPAVAYMWILPTNAKFTTFWIVTLSIPPLGSHFWGIQIVNS